MKTLPVLLLTSLSLAAGMNFSQGPKIAVQNTILSQVNGKTISMIDVKKKMDLMFHQTYPQLIDSAPARVQFYEASWRRVLMDLIDHELILAEAAEKEIKLTDGEVREVMEERFGPNVMQTLDKIGLTYDETWKMVRNELIVQRMSWWFIQSKAVTSVTPQDIRQAYRLHLIEHPPYSEWNYRVISIRVQEPNEALSEQVYQLLLESEAPPEALEGTLKQLETPGVSIALSSEYKAKTQELSDTHQAALSVLAPGTYSKPSAQVSRIDQKTVYRIFYLIGKQEFPAPAFESLAHDLRDQLIEKAVAQESELYLSKLRKYYGLDMKKTVPEDLHPFSLQ